MDPVKQEAETFWGTIMPRSFQVISKAINKYIVSTDSGQFAVKSTNRYKAYFQLFKKVWAGD